MSDLFTAGQQLGASGGAAQDLLGSASAYAEYSAQKDYRQQRYATGLRSARNNLYQTYRTLQERHQETYERSVDEINRTVNAMYTAVGMSETAAAHAGVSGQSVADLYRNYTIQASERAELIRRNQQFQDIQLGLEASAARSEAMTQAINAAGGPIGSPNAKYAQAGLSGGAALLTFLL